MENYPASISNFESVLVICQNTEKIWVRILYDIRQKTNFICAQKVLWGLFSLVFFSVNIKTKHPSQYEQIQQNITDLLF